MMEDLGNKVHVIIGKKVEKEFFVPNKRPITIDQFKNLKIGKESSKVFKLNRYLNYIFKIKFKYLFIYLNYCDNFFIFNIKNIF